MMTHLPDIPVAILLSHVCKFTLFIGRPVSQFSGQHINDFLGRGRVVIEVAGLDVPLVSI